MVPILVWMHSCLAADLRIGTRTALSFGDAVALHRIIQTVEKAATSGRRVNLQAPRAAPLFSRTPVLVFVTTGRDGGQSSAVGRLRQVSSSSLKTAASLHR
jgi:hypothetical protein